MDQVERYFFGSADPKRARRRIRALELAGLLRKEKSHTLGQRHLLRLTHKGEIFLKESDPDQNWIQIPQRLNISTLDHDRLVTSVSLRLAELWDMEWIPERALKREEFREIPDGLALFSSGERAAVEIERTLKSRSRLLRLFSRWKEISVFVVLYVATSETVYKGLQSAFQETDPNLPFALIRLDELLNSKSPIAWTGQGEIELFSKRSY
jgi:hypothetical protein